MYSKAYGKKWFLSRRLVRSSRLRRLKFPIYMPKKLYNYSELHLYTTTTIIQLVDKNCSTFRLRTPLIQHRDEDSAIILFEPPTQIGRLEGWTFYPLMFNRYEICVVCQFDQLELKELEIVLVWLPDCEHRICFRCLVNWIDSCYEKFLSDVLCPYCRRHLDLFNRPFRFLE